MRFLYKLPIDNRTEIWYNGGPLLSAAARNSDRIHICKIFVQSSRLSYGLLFSRKLTFQSNFIFIPSLTHISNFIWHTAHSTSMQLTKFQLLIADLLRYRSGPAFRVKTREKEQKLNNKSGSPVNPIEPATLFPLDFYNKICYYIKKRHKNVSVLA